MIDEPGPWGTGPFTLVEGHSTIDGEEIVIRREPFASTWTYTEERTPTVRLVANPNYWDKARGPRLQEVVFRNDVAPSQALELVCNAEGEVDILTELAPADAARVRASQFAKLAAIDAGRVVAGVINRDAVGLSFADRRARQALNLAVDRGRLVKEAFFGHAVALAGITPSFALSGGHGPKPPAHDPRKAAELWNAAGGTGCRPLRIAAWGMTGPAARRVADDLRAALGVQCEVTLVSEGRDERAARRRLAEKREPLPWDVLILLQGTQSVDAPPLELHRAFVGESGEFRAGAAVPAFEHLYAELVRQTAVPAQAAACQKIDQFVYDEALALFLCAPRALYAVNKEVAFTPYRTTFELAECEAGRRHWSRRPA